MPATAVDTNTRLPVGAWKSDPIHSSAGFAVKHMVVATFRGRFEKLDATLTVGEDGFSSLLKDWVAEHAGGSVTTEDFRAFAAARTETDLDDLFTAWLDQAPLPDLPGA